ncbi:hypothetical protein ZHAS_00007168 [Anopheles sinensis]|uniref:Uncharacterized protein n=1 Tax=Anopheles sinensis TaxID=74873 RepID=A0A084VPA7_ANOSI|nr:hypothetical protein ZHAS_00007168 [Anopheles sinensis]
MMMDQLAEETFYHIDKKKTTSFHCSQQFDDSLRRCVIEPMDVSALQTDRRLRCHLSIISAR